MILSHPQYNKKKLKHVGTDVYISNNVDIRYPDKISIGSHAAIDTGFYITTNGDFGDYLHIGPYVKIIGGEKAYFKMGNFTNIAAGSTILCGSDSFLGEGLVSAPGIPKEFLGNINILPVTIDKFANIGSHVVIFPGVTIAEGSVIGACSMVKENTKPWTIYAGIPAKPIKNREKKYMLRYAKKMGY